MIVTLYIISCCGKQNCLAIHVNYPDSLTDSVLTHLNYSACKICWQFVGAVFCGESLRCCVFLPGCHKWSGAHFKLCSVCKTK